MEKPEKPTPINHVPTTEEIQAAKEVEANHTFGDAISRQDVDTILRGEGVVLPERPKSERVSVTEPVAQTQPPAHEPFIEPANERTMRPDQVARLREDYLRDHPDSAAK